ncbi:hypothetical protein G6F68_020055 [Rhizopus microsporus]|nr:hypothetical protein G6F68_020055 [Rhizopus microsporus]
MARLRPSAAEMITPSWSAIGTPGHSPRKAQSSCSGVMSICEMTSGWRAAASAEAHGECVWMMDCTSGRASYTHRWKRVAGLGMPSPVRVCRSRSTSMKSAGVASSKPRPKRRVQYAPGRAERTLICPARPASCSVIARMRQA